MSITNYSHTHKHRHEFVYKFFKLPEQDKVNLLWVNLCLKKVLLSNIVTLDSVMLDKCVYSKVKLYEVVYSRVLDKGQYSNLIVENEINSNEIQTKKMLSLLHQWVNPGLIAGSNPPLSYGVPGQKVNSLNHSATNHV